MMDLNSELSFSCAGVILIIQLYAAQNKNRAATLYNAFAFGALIFVGLYYLGN